MQCSKFGSQCFRFSVRCALLFSVFLDSFSRPIAWRYEILSFYFNDTESRVQTICFWWTSLADGNIVHILWQIGWIWSCLLDTNVFLVAGSKPTSRIWIYLTNVLMTCKAPSICTAERTLQTLTCICHGGTLFSTPCRETMTSSSSCTQKGLTFRLAVVNINWTEDSDRH